MGDSLNFSYELPSINSDTAKFITERVDVFKVVFSIGFFICGAFLTVLGITNLVKKYSRLATSLAGCYFLGVLTYNFGSIIKCSSSFATSYNLMGSLQEKSVESFCGYFGGEPLKYIYISTAIFGIVGLLGIFFWGSLQQVIIGFGIGSSLAGLLNWFSVSFLVIIIFNVFISSIAGFLMYRFSNKLSLGINWISSYSVALGCIVIIESAFMISDFHIEYWGYCILSSACFVTSVILFGIVSRSELFNKSAKFDCNTAFKI